LIGTVSNPENYLEILSKDLNPNEKDQCKIIISEYLNDSSKNKKINAKNANQLFFIIDYLIQFINNKERVYKEKMGNLLEDNKELIKIIEDNKIKFELLEKMFTDNLDVSEKIKNLNMNFEYESVLKTRNFKYRKDNQETEENIYMKEKVSKEDNKLSDRASESVSNNLREEKKIDPSHKIEIKEDSIGNTIIYKKSLPHKKV
jgi:hypothetical protein